MLASVHTRFETYPRYYKLGFIEPVVEAWLRGLYRRCDALVTPSPSMIEVLREQRMNDDIGLWSRGVERAVFNPQRRSAEWRRQLGFGDDEVVIGFLGRLVMEKGLDVFAETIAELEKRGGAAPGDGDRRRPGARLVRRNGCPAPASSVSRAATISAARSPRWTCCSIPASPRPSAT